MNSSHTGKNHQSTFGVPCTVNRACEYCSTRLDPGEIWSGLTRSILGVTTQPTEGEKQKLDPPPLSQSEDVVLVPSQAARSRALHVELYPDSVRKVAAVENCKRYSILTHGTVNQAPGRCLRYALCLRMLQYPWDTCSRVSG